MLERSAFHRAFTKSLSGDEDALAPYLVDPTHVGRARVYRNNVVTACADAIVKNFPTVERLVGEEFMRAAAVEFVNTQAPTDPVLALYGSAFPEFLETFPPAAQLAYLPDVARLDWAWMESFFALNITPLVPEDIAGLDEAAVSALAPGLHSSARLLTSSWNAWEIWKANRGEAKEAPLTLKEQPSAALLWWSQDGVTDRLLTGSEYTFLKAIKSGASFGAALSTSVGDDGGAALFGFFSEVLSRGVFAATEKQTS